MDKAKQIRREGYALLRRSELRSLRTIFVAGRWPMRRSKPSASMKTRLLRVRRWLNLLFVHALALRSLPGRVLG